MTRLSNEHIADEQTVNDLFAAAYKGDTAEYDRIADSVEDAGDTEETDEPEIIEDEEATSDDAPDSEVDDGSDDASVDGGEIEDDSEDDTAKAKAELESLRSDLHRYKSDAGRVPFLNRRVQELERQLEDSRRSPAPKPDAKVEMPSGVRERIERIREVDPETADAMEEVYKASAAKAEEVRAAQEAEIANRRQREDDEYLHKEAERLFAIIPEAPQVFASEKWRLWKSKLPPNFRALAESSNADEVAEALRNFKVDAERHLGGYDWAPKPVEQSPSPAATKDRRLTTAPRVRRAAARPVTSEFDVDQIFKEAYEANLRSL